MGITSVVRLTQYGPVPKILLSIIPAKSRAWNEICIVGIALTGIALPGSKREMNMRSNTTRVFAAGAAAIMIGIYAETGFSGNNNLPKNDPVNLAVEKGVKWLVSVQGKDGGWGQDGGETSYIRKGEHLESNGNDVANTAVAAEALLHTGTTATSGQYRESFNRAVDFVLEHVEASPT